MLTKVSISNYASCKEVAIDHLGRVTVLVGRNGAGKTNVLRAIDWASSFAASPQHLSFHRALNRRSTSPRVELECTLGEKGYRYSLELDQSRGVTPKGGRALSIVLRERVQIEGKKTWTTVVAREGATIKVRGRSRHISIPPTSPSIPTLASVLPADDAINVQLLPLAQFLGGVRYYHYDEPTDPQVTRMIDEDEYKQWLALWGGPPNDPGESVPLRLIQMWLERADDFTELKDLLGPSGLDLLDDIRIDRIDIPSLGSERSSRSRRFYSIGFAPSGCQDDVDYRSLSLGTRRILRIILSLLFDKATVILGDHPEDGIHSGLTGKLVGLLQAYSSPTQLLLASHSLVILNKLSPTEIRLVSIRDGGTRVRSLTEKELKAAESFIGEQGTLADVIEAIDE